MNENALSRIIIEAALRVHSRLGPGLLESVYEAVLAEGLRRRGLQVQCQTPISINSDDLFIPDAFRADLIVAQSVLLELKSVEGLKPIHGKQVITYLRLSGLRLGLLINFNVVRLKDGIERFVNGLPD